MPSLTIPDLDPDLHARLRHRAETHGRTVEAEAKAILSEKTSEAAQKKPPPMTGAEFLAAARACMSESGGFEDGEFVQPERPPPRDPPDFS